MDDKYQKGCLSVCLYNCRSVV